MGYQWESYKESQQYGVDQSEFNAKKKYISEKEFKEEEKRQNIIGQISGVISAVKDIYSQITSKEKELDVLPEFDIVVSSGEFSFRFEKKVTIDKRKKTKDTVYVCSVISIPSVFYTENGEQEEFKFIFVGADSKKGEYKYLANTVIPYEFEKLKINIQGV